MKTMDSLCIYWNFESESRSFQDEVSGIIFYGYWSGEFPKKTLLEMERFKGIWKNSEFEVNTRLWDGERNCDLSVELWIKKFPQAGWVDNIDSSLKWFWECGAVLSWCGGELSSPSLESFSKNKFAGEVYAAYSESTGSICKSDLYDEYVILDDFELSKLGNVIQHY